MPLVFSEPVAKFDVTQEEDDIVTKVRKMLDLAIHAETPEAEANHAMVNAQRIMRKYNLDERTVRAAGAPRRGNLYSLTVTTTRGRKPSFWMWMRDVADAVSLAFPCKYFWNADIRFTFYGLDDTAHAAAAVFARYAQYIDDRVRQWDPFGGASRDFTVLRKERVAYCNGMVNGLIAAVRDEQQREQQRRRQLQEYVDLMERLAEEPDDLYEDMLQQQERELGLTRDSVGKELVAIDSLETEWKSAAEDIIKETTTKLRTAGTRTVSGGASASYNTGFQDGKRMRDQPALSSSSSAKQIKRE